MRMHALFAFVASLALFAGASHAQDFVAPASVESFSAVDGFGSHSVNVQSGAAENEEPLAAPCGGDVSHVAQAHFFYTSGAHALVVSAQSQAPVTLLIADPQGEWHCESSQGPSLAFEPAASGRYALWVGAVGAPAAATIVLEEQDISESAAAQ